MKIEKQEWFVGNLHTNEEGYYEIEIINKKNQSRICRITISDFRTTVKAVKIAKSIASLPELMKKKR